jgi:hypothetical protein
MFDDDCLTNEFLLTTEDTAIDMQLLKYLDQEVVQGACPFLFKANLRYITACTDIVRAGQRKIKTYLDKGVPAIL